MNFQTGHLRRRPHATASSLLIASVAAASFGSGLVSMMFVQGSPGTIQHYITADKTQVQAFFGQASTQTNSGEQVYSAFASKFPLAAKQGNYLGVPCGKAEILERFRALSQTMGEDVAVDVASKEPIVLMQTGTFVQRTIDYLKGLENNDEQGLALQIVQNNPRLLTIPAYELQRTKPSLQSLKMSAAAIDFIRPLGEAGLLVAIFGGFILLLVVLRPLLYGVKGQPSLVEMLLSPVTTAFPALTTFSPVAFREYLEGYGISLPYLVALIPLYQVGSSLFSRANADKQRS